MNLEASERLAREGRLYPSVILYGGERLDRQRAALRLGRTLLCAAAAESRPCGVCRHCARVTWPGDSNESFHPDFRVLERDLKTATSVEATKALLQMAQLAPFEARGQVFVIANAETLTGEAANALLKTLEEPPTRSSRNFLLSSPSLFDLLPTVRSRSMPLYLGLDRGPDRERVRQVADRFAASVALYLESGSTLDLLAAAEALSAAGGWKDPRASEPWALAAAAVKESRSALPGAPSARLLALAEDLLEGWRLRLRGVQPQRILDGKVVLHLAGGVGRADRDEPELSGHRLAR